MQHSLFFTWIPYVLPSSCPHTSGLRYHLFQIMWQWQSALQPFRLLSRISDRTEDRWPRFASQIHPTPPPAPPGPPAFATRRRHAIHTDAMRSVSVKVPISAPPWPCWLEGSERQVRIQLSRLWPIGSTNDETSKHAEGTCWSEARKRCSGSCGEYSTRD